MPEQPMNAQDYPINMPAGFYGKIPSAGDFVSRRVSPNTVFIWDNWLRHSLYENRGLSGTAHHAHPAHPSHRTDLWNFIVPADICGEPLIGMIAPSRDRVGRQFPFTMFKPLPQKIDADMRLDQVSVFFADHQPIISALFQRNLSIVQLEHMLAASGAALPGDSIAKRSPSSMPATAAPREGDIFAILNGADDHCGNPGRMPSHCSPVPWPSLVLSDVIAGSISYWWSNQSGRGATRALTHTGGLNQTLFNTLFFSAF